MSGYNPKKSPSYTKKGPGRFHKQGKGRKS
jgi:hypothetical protein